MTGSGDEGERERTREYVSYRAFCFALYEHIAWLGRAEGGTGPERRRETETEIHRGRGRKTLLVLICRVSNTRSRRGEPGERQAARAISMKIQGQGLSMLITAPLSLSRVADVCGSAVDPYNGWGRLVS